MLIDTTPFADLESNFMRSVVMLRQRFPGLQPLWLFLWRLEVRRLLDRDARRSRSLR